VNQSAWSRRPGRSPVEPVEAGKQPRRPALHAVGVRSHVVHETGLEQPYREVVHGLPEAPRHRAGRDRREDAAIHDTLHPVEVAEEARRPLGVGEKHTQSSYLRLEQRPLEESSPVCVYGDSTST